jgi:hypothetical protein
MRGSLPRQMLQVNRKQTRAETTARTLKLFAKWSLILQLSIHAFVAM